MRRLKSICALMVLALVACTSGSSVDANAEDHRRQGEQNGPPAWVVEAWETGEAPIVPEAGPPAWVVEAWQDGERPQRPTGPPPWVAARHEMAKELGLPGPPPEVVEAWENGEGFDLAGPPDFIRDLLEL